jgi:serine/threonine protein kinase
MGRITMSADLDGVPEKTLAEILAHRVTTGVPIPVPLTLAILRQVCDALEWAHNLTDANGQPLGIVHRDVSPSWIVVAENGAVRLMGSMALHPNAAYLAPEFVATGMVDSRADLFALGVVAHELLANRPLFASGSDAETIQRVCTQPIPPPSQFNPAVPPDVDSLVLMALARDPAYRWQYAAMLREGLLSVMQRLNFEMGPTQVTAWSDLFWGRVEAVQAPLVQFAGPSSQPSRPTPAPDLGRRTPQPRMATDPAIHEFMSSLDPSSSQPQVPAAPIEEPPLPSMSDPPPNNRGFELDIPEGTQIGAVPLISFENTGTSTPSFGEAQKQPRLARPSLPPPVALTSTAPVEEDEDDRARRKKKWILIAAAAAVVIGGAVTTVLLLVVD